MVVSNIHHPRPASIPRARRLPTVQIPQFSQNSSSSSGSGTSAIWWIIGIGIIVGMLLAGSQDKTTPEDFFKTAVPKVEPSIEW